MPVAILCGPIWIFGRKRVKWTWVDYTVAWLPLIIWFLLIWMNLKSKSLSNLAETQFIGVLMPLCPAIRLIGKNWMEERKMARITAALGIVIAIAVYLITPGLPE